MGIAPESLIKWISRHISDLTEEGSIDRFELLYDAHSSPFRIDIFELEAEAQLDALEVAQAIFEKAEEYANNKRGHMHRFMLLAFRADGEEHESSTNFMVQGKFLMSEAMETEPGDEHGALAQVMRHQEQTMLMMTKVIEGTMGRMLAENQELQGKTRRLEADREDVYRLKERLLSDQEDRDLRRLEAEQKAARMDKMLGMFMQSMPLLLGAVAKAVNSKGVSVSEESQQNKSLAGRLRSVVAGLDTEALTELASKLAPEKQQELMLLLGELNEPEESSPFPPSTEPDS